MIFQMACLSAWASDRISEDELHRIFEGAAIRNNLSAITGALFCSENSFFHIAEGSKGELAGLETRLENDPRIRFVKRVALEPISARCFDDWSVIVDRPELVPSEGCAMQCTTCPQASICSIADFLTVSAEKAADLPHTTRIMLNWFFRIQLRRHETFDMPAHPDVGPQTALA